MKKYLTLMISLSLLFFYSSLSFSAIQNLDGRFLVNNSVDLSTKSTGILSSTNGGTGQNNLTNLPLTTPRITTGIKDSNGLNIFTFSPVASAVNYLDIANSITATNPKITASGTDTNVSLNLVPKGTGTIQANGNGVLNFASAMSVNAAGNITTTSTTDVVATTMTITPTAGTYIAFFNSNASFSTNNLTLSYSFYANAVKVTNSERQFINASTQNRTSINLHAIITVSAGQAIDVRWRISSGTATMGNRILTLVRVG